MEFAFDAYVQGVQLQKATKSRLSQVIRALQKSKLARLWACLEAVSRNEKLSRQRASKVLLHVCRNTLRAAIDGWQDGVSEQQAERERLAVEHFKLESNKELCSKAILRIQRSQLTFAFGAYVQHLLWRKERKRKLSRAIVALQKIKLAWAWEFLSYMSRNRRISRQRASKVWLHVCKNTLRAVIDGWQDGVSEQQAEQER
eukprot:1748669-Rhodomonas_salina.1